MESRKLQKVGYSTLSISLPSNWVKENNLKRGDNVFIVPEKDGTLKLFPSKILRTTEGVEEYICNADLCDDPKMLERIIVGSYILGRTVFSMISADRMRSDHIEEIRAIIPKLIGLGIVEETSDKMTLQCSVDPRQFQLDMLLRRLSIISLTIVKESIQALVELDDSLAKSAIKREDEADMMYLLSMRLLMAAQKNRDIATEINLTDPSQILYYGLMLKNLEFIGDYAEETARRVVELLKKYKEKVPKWVVEKMSNLNDLAHDLTLKAVDCFFMGDLKIANSLLEMQAFIELERDRIMQDLPEIPHLRLILWNITRVAANGAAIALTAINSSLERKSEICSKRWSAKFK